MTRKELQREIYHLVGDYRKVDQIFKLFGKLSPEPGHGNIIDEKQAWIPKYNKSLIKKHTKLTFTPDQKASAREVLRALGMI